MYNNSKSSRVLDNYDYKGYNITVYESARAGADKRYRVVLRSSHNGLERRLNKGFATVWDARYHAEIFAETH